MEHQHRKVLPLSEVQLIYRTKTKPSERPQIITSYDTYKLLLELWEEDSIELIEQFKVLFLNRSNRVLGMYPVSTGGMTGTVADPRLILSAALKTPAVALILAHNHPSGGVQPSKQDTDLTFKIKMAAAYFDITVLDHVILSKETYFSFADEGLL